MNPLLQILDFPPRKSPVLDLQVVNKPPPNKPPIPTRWFLVYQTPLAFYCSSEMDAQEAFPGFVILEENITEEDENIVID